MTESAFPQDAQLLRPSVISLAFRDRAGLYAAYMPFIQNGGIFVPGARPCQIGDEVLLLLTLMQDESRYPVAGQVVWITPEGATHNHTPGTGVQFPADDSGLRVRQRIEALLGTALGTIRPTHTI
jgi:type IV pilus assembly protein PilZ